MKYSGVRLLIGVLLALASMGAQAGRIDVAATSGVGVVAVAADGQCSLREAMLLANGAATNGDCAASPDGSGALTIELPAGAVFTLLMGPYVADGPNGLPDVTGTYTIEGHGAIITRSTLAGLERFRLLHVATGADLTIRDVTISHGFTPDGQAGTGYAGGGIYNRGQLTLVNCTVSDNRTGDGSGGMGSALGWRGGPGGGIYNVGALTVIDSAIVENRTGDGGDAGCDSLDCFGGEGGDGGGLYSSSSATTVIVGSLIHGNVTGAGGAGDQIGPGGYGGGIANVWATGLMTIANTVVDDNLARGGGGGLYGHNAAFTIRASTFSNNEAVSVGGGAIRLVVSDLLLVNSTVAGNVAPAWGGLSALYSTVDISYVTIAGNTGGSLRLESSQPVPGTVIIDHSILAGPSSDALCGGDGSFISHGFNIVSDGSCGLDSAGDLENTKPLLGSLAQHGGPTPSMLPLPGSPAIDAIPAHACAAGVPDGVDVNFDQRGVARPSGVNCDVGAVELIATNRLRRLGGRNQQALAGDVFARALVVQALDGSGGPVPGVVPAVLVPGGGASAACSTEPTDATGIARIVCAANAQAGSYSVTLQTIGAGQAAISVEFTLTNLPNDRIFGSGFGGTALPTAESLP